MLVNNDATVAEDVIDGFERRFAHVRGRNPRRQGLFRRSAVHDLVRRTAGEQLLGYSGRPRGYGRPDGPRYQEVVDTDRAVGALMAISREAIEAAGLLDEGLFAYVEDVDFALRVREAGFEVVFAPDARAWHRVSASTGGEAASTTRCTTGRATRSRCSSAAGRWVASARRLRRALILATFSRTRSRVPTAARRWPPSARDSLMPGPASSGSARISARAPRRLRAPAGSTRASPSPLEPS